jgi:hypothetical protein
MDKTCDSPRLGERGKIDKARQSMDRRAMLSRERAAAKLCQRYADLRKEAEAFGLNLPPLE